MDNLRVAKVDNVILDRLLPPSDREPSATPKPERLTGTLHLTPHHLIFSPSPPSEPGPSTPSPEIWISYPSITGLTRLPQTFGGKYPLQIRTRNFEGYVMSFEKAMEGGAEDVWSSVKDCAVASSVEQLYAFFYTLPSSPAKPSQSVNSLAANVQPSTNSQGTGWSVYNPRTEFSRQGVGSRTKAWRFTDINKDYSYCPSYPAKMVVPSRISDSVLAYSGKYRSKGRIPALTYLHWANQPMVGLKNSRSAQDERLVECTFTTHLFTDTAYIAGPSTPSHVYGSTSTNLIVDARPTANAMANVAVGAGTENMENYKTAKKAYLGIDNIHVMRNSLKTINEAIREAESGGTLDRALLRKSNWLKHISTVLDGSLVIIKNIHLNASHVLIHCSDGWDRTAQLSAVAQLCLDPFYRTFNGFKILIEKDWLSFGYKFLDRSGHLSSEKLFTVEDPPDEDSDEEGGASRAAQAFFASVQKQFIKSDSHAKEVSPVFHQFLDCVWQIQRQMPDRFEFNEDWLLDLHCHLYACQFGTFLFNNEKQRRVPESGLPYVDRTVSAWDWYDSQREKYINPTYKPELDDRENRDSDQGVLMFDPRDVKFWYRLFRRGDDEMNGSRQVLFQGQGADMVTVQSGQVDPVSTEGAVEAVLQGTLVQGGSGQDGVRRSNAPLDGPSGRSTYRGVESTSSAFSLQTQGRHSPNPDVTSIVNQPATRNSANAGGWGWSQLSSGAFSAIQRGAKEIRTIGEGAYAQIRAEAGEYESSTGYGDSGESGTVLGEQSRYPRDGSSNGVVRTTRPGRIPSQANPWAASNAPLPTSKPVMREDFPKTSLSNHSTTTTSSTDRAPPLRNPSWSANPWGDGAMESKPSRTKTLTRTNNDTAETAAAPNQLNGLQQSLSDLTLLHSGLSTRSRSADTAAVPKTGNHVAANQDKALYEAAMGGDAKAWDPLGAI